MNELQKSIDSWEGKDIAQSCNKFILGRDFIPSGQGGWLQLHGSLLKSLSGNLLVQSLPYEYNLGTNLTHNQYVRWFNIDVSINYIWLTWYFFFIFSEGTLFKVTGRRWSERYVFLFDSLLILTKQNTKRSSVSGPMGEYKFKEKIPMRRVEYVIDKEDGEGQGQLVFRLQFNLHNSIVSKTLILL